VALCNVNATLGERDATVIDTMFEMDKPKALFALLNRRLDTLFFAHDIKRVDLIGSSGE